ncbi:MAG: hypothetical protein J6K90_00185 [Tidjanibacter sp.]|nr:hypothetical protein [Tidjanibacter sp.]
MRIKIFFLCVALSCMTFALSAQDYKNPMLVEEGRMDASSAIFPFPSRDLALAGDHSVESEYIVPLNEWTSTETEEGITYTTRFKVPYRWSDRVVLLRIEGVTNSYSVKLNDKYVGYSQAGHGRSQFNMTKLAQENYNTLSVTVYKNTAAESIEDSRGHDTQKIGRAFVVSQPKVRIKDLYVEAEYDQGAGLFSLGAVMESHLINPKEFTIYYELLAPSGETVAYGDKVLNTQMYSRDSVYFFTRIPQISAWTHETPVLYTLVVRTQYEGRFKEYVVGKVGFTNFKFDDAGRFFVNDKEVALVPEEADWQGDYESTAAYLRQLKESGVSLILVDSAPQPDEFYQLCDKLGLYVCNQADINTSKSGLGRVRGGNPSNDPQWTDSFVSRAEDMYLTSKNHPSVVAFSLADENSANGIALYEAYLKLKSLEKKRPIYYSSAEGEWNTDGLYMNPDAEVVNGELELVTDRAGEGVVMLRNTSAITTFNVKATYLTQRGAVKYAQMEEEITIQPGESYQCRVSLAEMVPGKKNNSLDITVSDVNPSFDYDASVEVAEPRILIHRKLGFYNSPTLEK